MRIASGANPVQGMERLALLGVDRDGTVHLLNSFFYVLVGPYSTDRRLIDFVGEFPSEGLSPVKDILVNDFVVR